MSPAGRQRVGAEGDVNGMSSGVALTWYMCRCSS